MCKISQPFVTYLIYASQHSDIARMPTSTDLTATKLFSRNREGMFQQDGSHAHTSKATIAWLDANIKHYIPPEDWPPNSPDLAPIKNVWSVMATADYAIDVINVFLRFLFRSRFLRFLTFFLFFPRFLF